jgi:hypothetical protein
MLSLNPSRRPALPAALASRAPAVALLAVLLAPLLASPASAQPTGLEVELVPVVGGLDRALGLVNAGDGSGRLFVIEQAGLVRVIRNGQVEAQPFLDVRGQVSCCGERGLLGLAFHPRFPADDRIFVHYTGGGGETRIVEMRTLSGGGRADPSSARTLLTQPQPFTNHNGGQIAFGPDGYLYIGLGDGGSGGDPLGNAQDVTTLLGSILRIDVDRTDPGLAYGIPPDNPAYPGVQGARREIWAMGLRNPWRFSFDRANGDLFVADVGQNRWEEIDRLPPGSAGVNLGWNRKEGDHCFEPETGCELPGLVLAEGGQEEGDVQDLGLGPPAAGSVDGGRAPDPAAAQVAVHVDAGERRAGAAPVAVAAGHRAAQGVAVLQDRVQQAGELAARLRLEAVVPLLAVPAQVDACAAGGQAVDLLPPVLPHVGHEQVAVRPVEGEAPRVAQPHGPDLPPGALDPGVRRVVRRDTVGKAGVAPLL